MKRPPKKAGKAKRSVSSGDLDSAFKCIADLSESMLKEKVQFKGAKDIPALKAAMQSLVEKTRVQSEGVAREQIAGVLDIVTDLAQLNFNHPFELVGDAGPIDGLITGLNMLSEELQHSVVARSELEKSEREFRSIFEQTTSGVALINLDGRIMKCNERYASFYGQTASNLKGKLVTDIMRMISGEVKHLDGLERRFVLPDGTAVWGLLNASRVENDQGEALFLVAILHDITEIKSLQAALITSSKMTALGEMSSGIAHEINNPLGIIQGKTNHLLKLMHAEKLTPEKSAAELEKISSETERIAKIIRGLRAFSRNGEKDPYAPVPMADILNNVLALCLERFKNNSITLEIAPIPQVTIECRDVQIAQVLTNLLNNSFDAVNALTEKWVRVAIESKADQVRITVTDSGKGLPPDVAEKLMQPFFTTKEVGKGTGLGLSISKGIIEEHGGHLWLERSSPHTQFIIELPIKQK